MRKCCTHFQRPRALAWFLFLAAFGTCIAAGSWQVNRLQWKQGLLADIAQANTHAPVTTLPTDDAALTALQFQPVKLSGSWRGDIEFHLAPRYWRDQFGYHVITPFTLADGRTLLVNRGWVPSRLKRPESRPDTTVRGRATLTGMVRAGAERSYFTPLSQPEKNIWFGRDTADMAVFGKLSKVVPVMVDLIGTQDMKQLPIPSDGTIRLRNDHLSYIITWYGIALGILVIFVLSHRKKA